MIEKKLRKYIIPHILAMTGISLYVLADTYFISLSQGANGITALNLVLPLYGLIFAVGSMLGTGFATRYSLSKHIGNKDYDQYFTASCLWTITISLFFVISGLFFSDTILKLMGGDSTIVAVGRTYLKIVLCCTPFFMLNYTFTSFVRNDGAPRIAMMATITSGIFNIIFDYIFMFPLQMKMAGAALATGISPLVSMSVCMIHYLSKNNSIKLVKPQLSLKKLFLACQLGVVSFVGEIYSGNTPKVFNFLLLNLSGNIAVAAYGVIANTALVGIALLNGVAQGLQPLASEVHSQNNKHDEKRIYIHSLWIAGSIATLLFMMILAAGDLLISVFNNEHSMQLAKIASTGIRLYFLGFLFAFFNIVTSGFYSAIGEGKKSSIIAFTRGIVAIVFYAFLLSVPFGITGVWLAFPAAELTTLLITVLGIQKSRNT